MQRARQRFGRRSPPPLPWRRPRHELLLLALVALAALTPVYAIDAQDVSRICLTRALLHGQLHNDSCLGSSFAVDRSSYGGHFYSDKAPGMSLLEIPGVAAARVPSVQYWPLESLRIWIVRLLAGGLAYLVGAFLVGRLSEGLAPGYGAPALVAFALGTLAAPLAAANFEHVTAGTLGLASFALAWRRRVYLAGLAAGAALLVAYEAALIAAILACYVALQGWRALARFLRGVLPGLALLWTYNWLAFGAPWRFSYRYVVGSFASDQAAGLFGVHMPTLHGIGVVFLGGSGLLWTSPVSLAAAYGLVRLARGRRAEALTAAAVCAAFAVLDCGYFDPYGGLSPGPRFLAPALPFLALGLAPAFAARFRASAVLAVASVVAMTAVTLSWVNLTPSPGTIWRELARLPADLGSAPLLTHLTSNVLVWLGASYQEGALLVCLAAAAALVLALRRPRRQGALR